MSRATHREALEFPALHLDEVAAVLGFAPATLRATKAITAPDMHSRRRARMPRGERGRVYAVNDIVEWLRRILPRLDPQTELALHLAAESEGNRE